MSAITRAALVLRVFTPQHPERGLAEVAAATRINKPTTLRLLNALCEAGLMYRSPATGRYRPSYEFLRLAEVVKAPSDLLSQARPFMKAVRDRLQETVLIAVCSGDYRVNLEQLEGQQPVRRVVKIGEPIPLYVSASSKVLLSGWDDEAIEAYLARTEFKALSSTTTTDPARLRRDVRAVRRAGYCAAISEGGSDGAAVSAPVRDSSGAVIAALSVTVPVSRYGPKLKARMVEEVTEAVHAVSRGMGYRG